MLDVTGSIRPDAAQDATAAVQALIDAGRLDLYFPPGTYDFAGPLHLRDKPVTLAGAGFGSSILRWTKPDGGLRGHEAVPTIRDLTLATTAPNGGDAMRFSWDQRPTWPQSMGVVERVTLRPDPSYWHGAYWTKGLVLENAWGFQVSRLVFQGNTDDNFAATAGIDIGGMSLEVHVSHCFVTCAAYGATVRGAAQAPVFSFMRAAGVQYGVLIQSSDPQPGAVIADCHFNAQYAGVFLVHQAQAFVRHNLIYSWDEDPAFTGVFAWGCDDLQCHGNTIPIPTPMGHGIAIAASDGCVVSGNSVRTGAVGIWMQAGTRRCNASGNIATTLDHGRANSLSGNGSSAEAA